MSEEIITLTIVTTLGFLTGTITVFVLSEQNLRTALHATYQAILRIRSKQKRRHEYPGDYASHLSPDNTLQKNAYPCDSPGPGVDARALKAVRDFRRSMETVFGDKLLRVYMFGSRARGDFRCTSDVDVAVVVVGHADVGLYSQGRLTWAAFKIMLSQGLYLQVRVMGENSMRTSCLLPVISREGLEV